MQQETLLLILQPVMSGKTANSSTAHRSAEVMATSSSLCRVPGPLPAALRDRKAGFWLS